MEEAGASLLRLPNARCLPSGLKTAWPEFAHAAIEAYGYGEAVTRMGPPSATAITRMDEAFGWVALIPDDRKSLRRIVLMRSLVNISERHIWSWRRIGDALGWNHEAVRQWHAEAIDIMVDELNLRRPQPRQRRVAAR